MATRLYLANGAAFDPGFTVPQDAGWEQFDGADTRLMVPVAVAQSFTTMAFASSAAGNDRLCRIFVSPEMAAGNAFTTATTFTMQVLGLESAINDNIINRVRKVTIVSANGQTVRATLIAIGNAASVVEYNTTLRNLTFLNANVSAANYTTVVGDRLCVEHGYKDSAGASISGTFQYGANSGGTGDLGVNETDVTATLRAWFETSLNIVWAKSLPVHSKVRAREYHHLTQ
jgi:hypothetical protein